MLRKLCGDPEHVAIVINKWGSVGVETSNELETELLAFLERVLDKGARTTFHDNTAPSARNVIRFLLPQRYFRPLPNETPRISVVPSTTCGAQYQVVTFL
jgi:hypothetical protein